MIFNPNAPTSIGYNEGISDMGGINYSLSAEYGVLPWLGFGVNISHTTFLMHTFLTDDISNLLEVAPEIGYHIPWKNKWMDVKGELGAGYSRYYFDSKGGLFVRTTITGLAIFFGTNLRVFYTQKQRLGSYVYYRVSGLWGTGTTRDQLISQYEYQVNVTSHTFGLGIFYRFGTSRLKVNSDLLNSK